jgi:hypothetical protein
MNAIITISDGTTMLDISPKSCVLTEAVCNKNLQHVENSCAVSFEYEADLFAMFVANERLSAVVKDANGNTTFTGLITSDLSWKDQGNPYPIESLDVTIKDYTSKLDVKIKADIGLIGTTVSAVISKVAGDCGLSVGSVLPTTAVPAFVVKKGRTYLSVLNVFLFQYGYSFYFDAFGNLCLFQFSNIPSSLETFDDLCLDAGVTTQKTAREYTGIETTYNPLKTITNTQVFLETPSYDNSNIPDKILIQPGDYYPFESNPTTEASEGQVYQSFESGYPESKIKYNGEIELKRTSDTELLYTSNQYVVEKWTGPLVVDRTSFEFLRSSVRFHNTGSEDAYLKWFEIRADAMYREADVTINAGSDDSPYSLDCEFIYDATHATFIALVLSRYLLLGNFSSTISLDSLVDIGVYRHLDFGLSGLSFDALLYSRTFDFDTEVYSYAVMSISAAAVDITRFKTQNSNTMPQQAATSAEISEIATTVAREETVALTLSAPYATRNRAGAVTPETIKASASYSTLNLFSGIFVISVSADGTTYIDKYTSLEKETSKTYTLPATVKIDDVNYYVAFVRFRLYADDTLKILKKEQIISISPDVSVVPLYLGAHEEPPTSGFVANDYYFDTHTTEDGGGILLYWTGSTWSELTATNIIYTEAVKTALADMVAWCTTNSGTIGSVTAFITAIINNLVARTAIIDYLATSTQVSTALCDDGATRRMEIAWDSAIERLRSSDKSRYTEITDASINLYNDILYSRKLISIGKGSISWKDSPVGLAETYIASIARLASSGNLLLDGNILANITCPWGNSSPISSDIGAGATYVQRINGELRIAYRNSSRILTERVWNSSTATWGSASSIGSMSINNVRPSYIQLANGDLRIAYTNDSNRLVERTWNKDSSTWSVESPIESDVYEPSYIQLANGDLRISYSNANAVLYERIWISSTQTWGEPLTISTWGSNAVYVQRANGDLRIAYTNSSNNLVERTWNKGSSTWGVESLIASDALFPAYVQTASKELHIIYNTSVLSLAEKVWNDSTSTWGAASTISTSQFTRPFAIQLADGELRVGYSNNLGVISEIRKDQYARIGAGIIESGSNSNGSWIMFSFGIVMEFGTGAFAGTGTGQRLSTINWPRQVDIVLNVEMTVQWATVNENNGIYGASISTTGCTFVSSCINSSAGTYSYYWFMIGKKR